MAAKQEAPKNVSTALHALAHSEPKANATVVAVQAAVPVTAKIQKVEPVKNVTTLAEPVKNVTTLAEPVKNVTTLAEPVKNATIAAVQASTAELVAALAIPEGETAKSLAKTEPVKNDTKSALAVPSKNETS